jgi:hypothetical protein
MQPFRALRLFLLAGFAAQVFAASFTFSTGDPDALVATAARTPQAGIVGIESADDFVLPLRTRIEHATFTGLLTGAAPDIADVNIDLYHVFPADSDTTRTPNVNTRVNSPADTEFDGRNFLAGTLSFSMSVVNPSFTAANSVLNGINPAPNQTTGGEGPVTGQEVLFDVTFTTPFDLPPDHYFFVPTVQVTGGEFYWLSSPRPIVAPGTPFMPDLQSWTRDENLDPDWSRVGADIIGGAAFNVAFSLSGTAVPEPSTAGFVVAGALALSFVRRFRRAI